MNEIFLSVLLVLAGVGCTNREPAAEEPANPPVLLVGEHRALDLGSFVVVYSSGFNSSTGWSVELVPEVPDGGPLRLQGIPPTGAAGAAMTPFLVSAVIPRTAGGSRPTTVEVRDARGLHRVAVERPETIGYEAWERLAVPVPR